LSKEIEELTKAQDEFNEIINEADPDLLDKILVFYNQIY